MEVLKFEPRHWRYKQNICTPPGTGVEDIIHRSGNGRKKRRAAMDEKQYEVYESENRIASHMSLETALLLIGAYCERYCNERARLTLLEMKK